MKIVSYRDEAGGSRVGVVVDDAVIDATGLLRPQAGGTSAMRRLLEDGRPLEDILSGLDGDPMPLDDLRLDPIVPDPGKIIAAPVNYFDHKAEMQEAYHVDSLGLFLKAPSSVIAAGEHIRLPYTDRRFDQEGELALVIGRRASHVTTEEALDHVAGYTLLLDITMRGGEDRSTRKSFDTFTPIGPFLVTPDETGPLASLRLRTWVGGELRQDADIADLIWDVPQLIAYASSVMTLHPGDVITTGTPAGVGQIGHGDRVAVAIEQLGRLEVGVTSEGAVACPTKGATTGPRPPATVTPVRAR
ncbi:fumarylacetoacetate hydrolase family protein [Microbacterium insulae]|uniref:Fumarylacetoacetate hydrolase family protein n=1 Tax=Microbacterium insulae TaxID=483014 RepID=A0ABW3AGX1_9MICO